MNELEAEGLAGEPGLEGKDSRHPNKGDSWEPCLVTLCALPEAEWYRIPPPHPLLSIELRKPWVTLLFLFLSVSSCGVGNLRPQGT